MCTACDPTFLRCNSRFLLQFAAYTPSVGVSATAIEKSRCWNVRNEYRTPRMRIYERARTTQCPFSRIRLSQERDIIPVINWNTASVWHYDVSNMSFSSLLSFLLLPDPNGPLGIVKLIRSPFLFRLPLVVLFLYLFFNNFHSNVRSPVVHPVTRFYDAGSSILLRFPAYQFHSNLVIVLLRRIIHILLGFLMKRARHCGHFQTKTDFRFDAKSEVGNRLV